MPRITITEPGKNPQPYRFELAIDDVRIGRGSENEIILECGSISGLHAEMARIPGGFELRDLGSTNGIMMAGNNIDVWRLSDGDQLRLGDVVFDFQLSEEEAAALAAEVESTPDSETPRKKPAPKEAPLSQRRGPSGRVLFLVFLLLGLIAFAVGLALRHEKETGVSLAKRLFNPQEEKVRETSSTAEDTEDISLQSDSEEEEGE